jgi:chromosome segregation ATPase
LKVKEIKAQIKKYESQKGTAEVRERVREKLHELRAKAKTMAVWSDAIESKILVKRGIVTMVKVAESLEAEQLANRIEKAGGRRGKKIMRAGALKSKVDKLKKQVQDLDAKAVAIKKELTTLKITSAWAHKKAMKAASNLDVPQKRRKEAMSRIASANKKAKDGIVRLSKFLGVVTAMASDKREVLTEARTELNKEVATSLEGQT